MHSKYYDGIHKKCIDSCMLHSVLNYKTVLSCDVYYYYKYNINKISYQIYFYSKKIITYWKSKNYLNDIFLIRILLQMSFANHFGFCMFCLFSLHPSPTLGHTCLVVPGT